MISPSEYAKEDLLLIKGQILILVVCVLLIAVIFWSAGFINNSAKAELQQARNQISEIRSSMDRAQLEASKAAQYIERYTNLQNAGIVDDEDRLQLLELFAQIRSRHQLFPISININEQAALTLPYENVSSSPGRPVQLRSSVLQISFPLLHEADLSRFLDDLLGSSWFLQPTACTIVSNHEGSTDYYYLDKHFAASCSMYWYTFHVTPDAEAQP